MIDVLFFAWIREQLGVDKVSIPPSVAIINVNELIQHLVNIHGKQWSDVLGADNVVVAVNQEVTTGNHPLADGDEVAFFPPVTGG